MTIRTRETTVTFKHPFKLSMLDELQPAGVYRLVVDEEEITNLSFLAFRQVATMLHMPAISAHTSSGQVVTVSSQELEAALAADSLI